MLIDVIGRGPFLKLNLHQISDKMVYNMTIFQTNKKKKIVLCIQNNRAFP